MSDALPVIEPSRKKHVKKVTVEFQDGSTETWEPAEGGSRAVSRARQTEKKTEGYPVTRTFEVGMVSINLALGEVKPAPLVQ